MTVQPAPTGRTARRLEWQFLPPGLRATIEQRLGSPVVSAASQRAGYTPGFASVLTCEDGSKHFVKAASVRAQRMFAAAYREEIRKLAALPDGVPAPRLLWSLEDEWVALSTEYVDGRLPRRPWSTADLDRCLDALEVVANRLTPVPVGLEVATFVDDNVELPGFWDHLRATRPDLPHLEEAAALAATYADVTAGDTLVHTDVRDDNVLLGRDGRAWFCDWNWPTRGAPWLDTVMLLIGPRGDGTDVDALLEERMLTRDVPADHVDVLLALLVGYFLRMADQPEPATSPHLRQHQRWQGEVCWEWLCERRGWA